jgi:hypothetical protein
MPERVLEIRGVHVDGTVIGTNMLRDDLIVFFVDAIGK